MSQATTNTRGRAAPLEQRVDPRERAPLGKEIGNHADVERGIRRRVVRADDHFFEAGGQQLDLVPDQRLPPELHQRLVPPHAGAGAAGEDPARHGMSHEERC
jgi:hypothetical protein